MRGNEVEMLRRAASASRNVIKEQKVGWFEWVPEYLDSVAADLEATTVPSEWWCKNHRVRTTASPCCVHADVVAWTTTTPNGGNGADA